MVGFDSQIDETYTLRQFGHSFILTFFRLYPQGILSMSRFLTLLVLLMLSMTSARPANAERSGIRGAFFDLISDPWKESADLKDEAVAARFVTD